MHHKDGGSVTLKITLRTHLALRHPSFRFSLSLAFHVWIAFDVMDARSEGLYGGGSNGGSGSERPGTELGLRLLQTEIVHLHHVLLNSLDNFGSSSMV